MDAEYMTLAEVAKRCPGRPSTNAVWRWCRKGVKSRSGITIRLAHVRVGGKIFVVRDDLSKFFADVTESDREHFERTNAPAPTRHQKPRSSSQRQRDIARANAELKAAGF